MTYISYTNLPSRNITGEPVLHCQDYFSYGDPYGPENLTPTYLQQLIAHPDTRTQGRVLSRLWEEAKRNQQAIYTAHPAFNKNSSLISKDFSPWTPEEEDASTPQRILVTPSGRVFLCYNKADTCIGKGTFKNVKLVEDFITGRLFASASIVIGTAGSVARTTHSEMDSEEWGYNRLSTTEGIVKRYCSFTYLSKKTDLLEQRVMKTRIITELGNAGSLANLISADTLKNRDKELIVAQMLRIVKSLHDLQLLHRDLKPSNFFCRWSRKEEREKNGRYTVLLGDLATICDFNHSQEKEMLRTTYWYCPPWLAKAYMNKNPGQFIQGVTQALDIWSLGITIFQLYSKDKLLWTKHTTLEKIFPSLIQFDSNDCLAVEHNRIIHNLLEYTNRADPKTIPSANTLLGYFIRQLNLRDTLEKQKLEQQKQIPALSAPKRPLPALTAPLPEARKNPKKRKAESQSTGKEKAAKVNPIPN